MKEIYINLKDQDEYFVWKWLEKTHKTDLISIDDLVGDIEDLLAEIERLEEKIEDREQEIQDNYKQITPEQMYG